MNPPIWENLPVTTKARDIKIQRAQKSLSKGLNAYLRTLSSSSISETQQDALALLCNAQYELNCLRKDFIKPDLNSKYSHLCKPSTPVSRLLFGDNLSKQVKDLKDQQLATAGVTKGSYGYGKTRPYSSQQHYHPYKGHASAQQRQYRAAGWTSSNPSYRPRSGTADRPFLGQGPQGRGRYQAPHTQTSMTRGQPKMQNPQARQGQNQGPNQRRK